MSSEKSVIVVPQTPKNLCPICGKAAYSANGIHPQCAVEQADEPRVLRLRSARAAAAKLPKPAPQTWKKKCPKCGTQLHVRQKMCKCSHGFANT